MSIRDLRIGRLRSNRIRIKSGVTVRIRIESLIESAVYIAIVDLTNSNVYTLHFMYFSSLKNIKFSNQ